MDVVPPVVRCMIPCDQIQGDENDSNKVSLINLILAIRSGDDPPFPHRNRLICFFVRLTECRTNASISVSVVHLDTGSSVFHGRAREVVLGPDPLHVYSLAFRLEGVLFPKPGLYVIEFWFNGDVLDSCPILLR